jgi:hypothetical protein
MAVLLAWLICPILFGISFLIQTSYFIYKLMTSQSVGYSGNPTVHTISFTSDEVTCCMGWIWNTCLDKITNHVSEVSGRFEFFSETIHPVIRANYKLLRARWSSTSSIN